MVSSFSIFFLDQGHLLLMPTSKIIGHCGLNQTQSFSRFWPLSTKSNLAQTFYPFWLTDHLAAWILTKAFFLDYLVHKPADPTSTPPDWGKKIRILGFFFYFPADPKFLAPFLGSGC